jgi:hypothetical protein
MNGDLEYINQEIEIYNNRIKRQKEKIKYIRDIIEDEPLYEVHVLKRLYAKRYSLQYKKDKLLNMLK